MQVPVVIVFVLTPAPLYVLCIGLYRSSVRYTCMECSLNMQGAPSVFRTGLIVELLRPLPRPDMAGRGRPKLLQTGAEVAFALAVIITRRGCDE